MSGRMENVGAEERKIVARARRLFKCDKARVVHGYGRWKFLIIGHIRRSEGKWSRNGRPLSFNFTEEKCIASGRSWADLWASAREYKRLCDLTRKHGTIGTWVRLGVLPAERDS